MSYNVVEAPSFWDSVAAIQQNDPHQADLVRTMLELRRQPFRNPVLQTHVVGNATNGKKIFSSDVGGRASDRRLVWQIFNNTIVVLLYGTHAVQRRAQRMRIAFNEADHLVTVYEQAPDTPVQRPYHRQRLEVGRLFMAWTDAELAAFGFDDAVIRRLRTLNTDEQFLALDAELPAPTYERAYNLLAFGDPEGQRPLPPPVVEAAAPAATSDDLQIERQLDDPRAGSLFTSTEPEFLAEILRKPIEDWMIFLHPDQRTLVRRSFEGPARVRGAAGTGKTVVALHRAAHLAAANRSAGVAEPVLFTTFIKSLPPVFEALYLRLPGTRTGEVEFVQVDKLARQICYQAGDRLNTDPRGIDAAFAKAFDRIVAPGTPLAQGRFSRQYLRDEITSVIKGRALSSLDTYLEIVRTGRRAPLGRNQRTQVWRLMQEWDAEMAKRGTVDFADVVIRARDHARRLSVPRYSAGIIDEAQDLTLAGLQLVRALVNAPDGADRRNGLLLVGDGAQRIYAGGFKLRQAGVEVRGRTAVLKVNYRNTHEILGTALAVAGDVNVDDLGEEFLRGEETATSLRHGVRPKLIVCRDLDEQLDTIAAKIAELPPTGVLGRGDVGVLVPTNWLADRVVSRLEAASVAVQRLNDYDGRPNSRIKVGTYHRGKGLEFKVVYLPGLSKGSFPRPPTDGMSEEEAAEARDLAISQLFVAMTRARDQLVVLSDESPSEFIAQRTDDFDAEISPTSRNR